MANESQRGRNNERNEERARMKEKEQKNRKIILHNPSTERQTDRVVDKEDEEKEDKQTDL